MKPGTATVNGDQKMTTSEIIKSAIKSYRYSKPTLVDGRLKEVKDALAIGWTKDMISVARAKFLKRLYRRVDERSKSPITHFDRIKFITALRECTYNPAATSSRYNCTGIDWKAFHRASSNGKGWVLIAPDEPGNNWYFEDFLLFRYLSNKYNG
jgi:hypothetical protein